jgi:hypothetical protein
MAAIGLWRRRDERDGSTSRVFDPIQQKYGDHSFEIDLSHELYAFLASNGYGRDTWSDPHLGKVVLAITRPGLPRVPVRMSSSECCQDGSLPGARFSLEQHQATASSATAVSTCSASQRRDS